MDILLAVFPAFLLVGLGVALRRYRFLDEGFIDPANSLVYYILLPTLLFNEISTADFREDFSLPLVAGGYAASLITLVIAFQFSRSYTPSVRGSFLQGTIRANFAYVGLPIVFNVAGQAGLRKAGILLAFVVPFLNAVSVLSLVLPHGMAKGKGADTAKRLLRQVATNPAIIGCAAGMLWSMFGIPVPGIARKTLQLLAPATLPLSLLCLGASFSLTRAREGISIALLAAFLKLIVLTAIGMELYRWMGVTGVDLRVGMIMLGCPTAVVTYVLASQLSGDTDLAGIIVIISTVISALTITGWLFLLQLMGW